MTDPDDDAHEGEWDDDEFEFDCHMGPDGQCDMAGSEECDFECPVMAAIYAAESRRRRAEKLAPRQCPTCDGWSCSCAKEDA